MRARELLRRLASGAALMLLLAGPATGQDLIRYSEASAVAELEAGQSGSDLFLVTGKFDQVAGDAGQHGALGYYERIGNAAIDWSTAAAETLYDGGEHGSVPMKPHLCRVCFVADTSATQANDTLRVVGAAYYWGTGTLVDPDSSTIVFSDTDSLNTFRETESDKGYIGDIIVRRVSGATNARSTNIFVAKPWTNFDVDFTVKKFNVDGGSNGTETDMRVYLFHHQDEGWTFRAAGMNFPGDWPAVIFSSEDDIGTTYDRFALKQHWGYRNDSGDTDIDVSEGEGIILMQDTATNESMEGNFQLLLERTS